MAYALRNRRDKMYKCVNCEGAFNHPEMEREDTGGYETGIGYYPYYEEFPCCPYCGSTMFDEADYCPDCENAYFEDELTLCNDGKVRCKECAKEWEKIMESIEDEQM